MEHVSELLLHRLPVMANVSENGRGQTVLHAERSKMGNVCVLLWDLKRKIAPFQLKSGLCFISQFFLR